MGLNRVVQCYVQILADARVFVFRTINKLVKYWFIRPCAHAFKVFVTVRPENNAMKQFAEKLPHLLVDKLTIIFGST